MGRNYPITLVWLLASISYYVGANIYGWPRYSPVLAASIAFSIGSMLSTMKMSMSYSGDRIHSLGDIPLELFREKCNDSDV